MYVLSDDTKVGQAVIMFFTITPFVFFVLPYFYFSKDVTFLVFFLFIGLLSNWFTSRNYYVYVKDGNFHLESLYVKKKVISGNSFSKIEKVWPRQPYYYLRLTDGQTYFFSRRKLADVLTSLKHGDKEIVERMTQAIQQELSQ